MKVKELQEKENINLQLQIKKKQKLKEKGITLIALVVTIIILLILAGVTLNMALSGDGLFSKAKLAVNKYDVASEQEVLQQIIIEHKMDNSTVKIGEQLSDRVSGITESNWKVIQLNNSDKNYGTSYYYIEKGTEIANYGQTKYNWVMNYETGEVINIEEYTVLDGNAGISVTDNLPLNINPVNLSDENSWGENIEFVYGADQNSEDSGVHGTELKFDGVDDYLIIKDVEIEESEGYTFEFFGKSKEHEFLTLLCKTNLDAESYGSWGNYLRSMLYPGSLHICCSGRDPKSENSIYENDKKWLGFSTNKVNIYEEIVYYSVVVDIKNSMIKVYEDGKEIDETLCDSQYIKDGAIFNKKIPFTLGVMVAGDGKLHLEYRFI